MFQLLVVPILMFKNLGIPGQPNLPQGDSSNQAPYLGFMDSHLVVKTITDL